MKPKKATEIKVNEIRKVELIFETPTHTRATEKEIEREPLAALCYVNF